MKRVLVFLVVFLLVMMLFDVSVNAEECQVQYAASLGTTPMLVNQYYHVDGGEVVTVSAYSRYGIAFSGYFYRYDNMDTEIVNNYGDIFSFQLPEKVGDEDVVELFIEVVANNDDGTSNTITKTGWQRYYLYYGEEYEKSVSAMTASGTYLKVDDNTEVSRYEEIQISAFPNDKVEKLYYCWNFDPEVYYLSDCTGTINITCLSAEPFQCDFYVCAKFNDGTLTEWTRYILNVK